MRKGFTLIELLVVVLIVGILAAIAVPYYQTAVDRARYAELFVLVAAAKNAQERYYMANGTYTTKFSDLDIEFPAKYQPQPGGNEGSIWVGDEYYLTLEYINTASKGHIYAKYIPAQVLYLVYMDSSDYAGRKECRSHRENATRGERICLSLGGKLSDRPGYMDGKIYDLTGT